MRLVVPLLVCTSCFTSTHDQGRFHGTWSLTVNGGAGTCAAVGASSVSIRSSVDGVTVRQDLFDCAEGMGTTNPYDPGDYTITAVLLKANGDVIQQLAPVHAALAANDITEIGPFDFGFTFHVFTFGVQFGAGDNCKTAGVVSEQIDIDDGTQCFAVDLTGTSVSATTCSPFECQVDATVYSSSGLADGTYTLHVEGLERVNTTSYDCYNADFPLDLHATEDLGTLAVPLAPVSPDDQANCQ